MFYDYDRKFVDVIFWLIFGLMYYQDFIGVLCVVDLVVMWDVIKCLGGDFSKINFLVCGLIGI